MNNEVYAAIAMALHEHLGNNVHDVETGIITINARPTQWAMRKHSHNIRKSMKEYKYTINGNKYEVVVGDIKDNIATLTVNGETYTVEMEKQPEPEKKKPVVKAATAAASDDAPAANKAAVNKANAIKAPDVLVAEGDEVKVGDTVVVLEAMKMANNLTAEKAGKVTAVCVKVGESVMEDDALVVIE